jgi:hypothetical protein
MSSVMRVIVIPESGRTFDAVLKLYDRRFGLDLRGNGYLTEHWPLTVAKEALFESFARSDAINSFFTKLAQDREKSWLGISSDHFTEDPYSDDEHACCIDDDADKRVKYEAALWQECEKMFDREVKAYEHLKDFQGTEVPRLLASVRLTGSSSIIPRDLIDEPAAKYWDVKGVLLQYVNGFNLSDLGDSSIDPKNWEALVQRSVDLAHKINISGLVMEDCAPRNVIVDQQSQQPFFIDFAQSWLKKNMDISYSLRPGPDEGEDDDGNDLNPEDEYWERARRKDNPGAIGTVMTTRLKRQKNVEIKIQYLY